MVDVTWWIALLLLAVWMVAAAAFALCAGRIISTAERKENTTPERDDPRSLTTPHR